MLITYEGQLDLLRKQIVELARAKIEETKKIYSRANLKSIVQTLGPPALAASIASLLDVGIIVPAGIVATLGMFAADKLIDIDKTRTESKYSPWSYVINVAKLK